jgi:hypothetical protein
MIIFFIQNLLGNLSQEELAENIKNWEIKDALTGNSNKKKFPSADSTEFDDPLCHQCLFVHPAHDYYFYCLNKSMLQQNTENKRLHVFFNLQLIAMHQNCFIINKDIFLKQIYEIFLKPTDINYNFLCQNDLSELNKKYFNVSDPKIKFLINPKKEVEYIFICPKEGDNLYIEYKNIVYKYFRGSDAVEKIEKLFFYAFLKMILRDAIIYTCNIANFESFDSLVLTDRNEANISNEFFILNENEKKTIILEQ